MNSIFTVIFWHLMNFFVKKYNLLHDFVKYLLNDTRIKTRNKFISLKLFCPHTAAADENDENEDDDDDDDE